MKIKDGFVMRNVAGKNVVVPVGEGMDFSEMLTLNDSGLFFWNLLNKNTSKEELLEAVLKEYDVKEDVAKKDIDDFIEKLRKHNILEG